MAKARRRRRRSQCNAGSTGQRYFFIWQLWHWLDAAWLLRGRAASLKALAASVSMLPSSEAVPSFCRSLLCCLLVTAAKIMHEGLSSCLEGCTAAVCSTVFVIVVATGKVSRDSLLLGERPLPLACSAYYHDTVTYTFEFCDILNF